LAERGEFTQRAFGNGKLTLLQVEALADLLTSDTQMQRQQALRQLDGTLQNLYQDWRQRLTKGLAHAEAVIDFGDDEQLDENEDEEAVGQLNVWGNVGNAITSLRRNMQHFLSDNRRGELVREGVKVAIVGPPNAGKSSLFNLLAKREAAIVSPIAGTTRDVLELTLDLGGVRCTLSDTAGVRENSEDIIEQEGMKRARSVAKQADIIVAVADVVDPKKGISVLEDVLKTMDTQHDDALDAKNVLLALNKLDLSDDLEDPHFVLPREVTAKLGGTFFMSCETNHGIDVFLEALTTTVLARVQTGNDESTLQTEGAIITRARHRQHVEGAVEALIRFETLSQQGTMAVDMAAEELRLATSELGRITGAVDVEDVLDVLFTDFCIGK
jgi:tRNA modification GTPase